MRDSRTNGRSRIKTAATRGPHSLFFLAQVHGVNAEHEEGRHRACPYRVFACGRGKVFACEWGKVATNGATVFSAVPALLFPVPALLTTQSPRAGPQYSPLSTQPSLLTTLPSSLQPPVSGLQSVSRRRRGLTTLPSSLQSPVSSLNPALLLPVPALLTTYYSPLTTHPSSLRSPARTRSLAEGASGSNHPSLLNPPSSLLTLLPANLQPKA